MTANKRPTTGRLTRRENHRPSRRELLLTAGGGFGALALSWLLHRDGLASDQEAPILRNVHFPARAKSVIFLFMDGGPSHLDLFDPKPEVNRLAGHPLPSGIERPITPMGVSESPLLPTRRTFRPAGQCGLPISDWLPHMATCADDLVVVRSCWANGLNHVGGVCQMNTGSILAGRPSLGAWVNYGLGTENQDLPAFVVLLDTEKEPPGGSRNWGTGFMPATYQGTQFRPGPRPILALDPPDEISAEEQAEKLALLRTLNLQHAKLRLEQTELDARIAAYELAFRMQAAAPEAVDLSTETATTASLYGLDQKETASMGRNCLLARRLVERGVRFVQLYCGAGSRWDAHSNIEENHSQLCAASDRPVAGLLRDLKQRGLLDETLVVWGGEFGRTPMSEKGDGRDHNPYGFTMCLAGGGLAGGRAIGATDEFGLFAVENRVHVHDLHASILHLLGLDHELLTYLHNGRDERATIDDGGLIPGLI